MSTIEVVHNPSPERLEQLNISSWPIWEKEASSFPWHYDSEEVCYFLQGAVTVTPEGGAPVTMGEGDLVTFPAGMSCHWEIHTTVRKHYQFN